MTGTKFAVTLALAVCTLAACSHRTVVERPVIVERESAPARTIVVPPGSDVTIDAD